MYIPKQFEEMRVGEMHGLIRAYPLATLVTMSSGGLNANHIPLHLSEAPAPYGALCGHVARSNPVWLDFARDVEVLTVFRGLDAYITPSWYASKKEHGKVVPCWNYVAVHAYGSLSIKTDVQWIRSQLEVLTGPIMRRHLQRNGGYRMLRTSLPKSLLKRSSELKSSSRNWLANGR